MNKQLALTGSSEDVEKYIITLEKSMTVQQSSAVIFRMLFETRKGKYKLLDWLEAHADPSTILETAIIDYQNFGNADRLITAQRLCNHIIKDAKIKPKLMTKLLTLLSD